MNEPFGETKQQSDSEITKKKQLWRNLFFTEFMRLFAFGRHFLVAFKAGAGG